MALGGSIFLKNATMLEQLLEEINFQRTKEMRQLLKDDSGFVVVQGTSYWTDLFVRHFLFQEEQNIDCDDLLFFVRKRHVKGSSRYLPKYETEVEVFRKDSKKLPIGDPEIDWEETVYLNLIVHQFEYTLTLAVCTRTSPKELQVLRRQSHKVYASPSKRKMDTKGDGEEITYPHICFMVDNFDEVFSDMVVRDGEMVCVEVVAAGRGGAAQAVIFLGSIRYDALTRVYESRQTSLSTKVAQRMSFGLMGKSAARCEFVRMKGPGGKGHAEMAVARPHAPGIATPSSEPGGPPDWDDDWDHDPEELFMYKHQRRLSDPSANVGMFARGGWRARDHARSENEGLDSLVAGVAEVDAGDVRDAECPRASSERCVCLRPLLHRPRDPELACDAAAIADATNELTAADKPLNLADKPPNYADRETVRGREEFPCRTQPQAKKTPVKVDSDSAPGVNEGARAYCTLPRKHSGVAAPVYKNIYCRLPPKRTTPDGTDIYYWCDLKTQRRSTELDDGAYNPVWALRGFSQSFHSWKEGRRRQCTPVAAFLTYVTLPWWSIASDILDHREEPILTF